MSLALPEPATLAGAVSARDRLALAKARTRRDGSWSRTVASGAKPVTMSPR